MTLNELSLRKMPKNEFNNIDEIKNEYENIIIITEKIGLIPINVPFEYDGKANSDIRKIVQNKLLTSYPELKLMKAGIHIAWSKPRYNELFNLKHRIKHPRYTRCAFTVGNPFKDGEHTKMPFIYWKRQYHDVSNCNDTNATYVYQTTKNTWKIFKCL